jgi:hypothetical protein
MLNSRFFLHLTLFAVLLAACAPTTSTAAPTQPQSINLTSTVAPAAPTVDSSTEATLAATQAPAPTALPVATSRGPNLEATDPTTVSLASGGLQLVEFFRFT